MIKKQTPKKIKELLTELETRTLRYTFTEKELVAQARLLAEKNRELARLEEDKKRVTSDFGAKINSCYSQISEIGNNVQTGYELRSIECTVQFDRPVKGKKRIFRNDSSEEVCIESMTPSEMQRQFDFSNPPKKEEAALKPGAPIVSVEKAVNNAEVVVPNDE